METMREYWEKHIRVRFNEPPNLILDTELIEFGSKALDKIDQLQAKLEQHRWILVSERLPKEKGYINVANAKLKIPQTWYWTNTNDEAQRLKAFMTHWQPIILPE